MFERQDFCFISGLHTEGWCLLQLFAKDFSQTRSTRNPRVCPENFKGRYRQTFWFHRLLKGLSKVSTARSFVGLWGVWLHLFHLNIKQRQHNQSFVKFSSLRQRWKPRNVRRLPKRHHRHTRMLKIRMCSPGKHGFSSCFYLSCWAFLFAAFLDQNLPEPFFFSGVNCKVSSCQHPESAGTHRLMLVPRRLGLHSAGGLWERFGCSHSLGRTGWGAHVIFFGISLLPPLLMDKKSCTTWDGAKTLYIMGKNYRPQQVTAGFLIHQQYETKMSFCFFGLWI